jgi:hypothetical protein
MMIAISKNNSNRPTFKVKNTMDALQAGLQISEDRG